MFFHVVSVAGRDCAVKYRRSDLGGGLTVEHTILTTLSYFTPPNEPHKRNYGDGGAALLLAPVGDDVGGLHITCFCRARVCVCIVVHYSKQHLGIHVHLCIGV